MMKVKSMLAASALFAGFVASTAAPAQDMMFGTEADAGYAALLWSAMVEKNLAGPDAVHSSLALGTEPHGLFEVFYASANIDGHTGELVVKRNYGTADEDEVAANYDGLLRAITVMFRREDGYDADNKNWFWTMFMPDGTVGKNEAGMQLAGRVAKGMDVGCLACHSAADGDDYIFTSNAIK